MRKKQNRGGKRDSTTGENKQERTGEKTQKQRKTQKAKEETRGGHYKKNLEKKRKKKMLGIPTPPCADRWCTDSCSQEVKQTETQYLTWFGKTAYIHGRVHIIRDIQRKDYNTHGGGGSLHSISTPSSLAALAAAAIAALHFHSTLFTFSQLSLSFAL